MGVGVSEKTQMYFGGQTPGLCNSSLACSVPPSQYGAVGNTQGIGVADGGKVGVGVTGHHLPPTGG